LNLGLTLERAGRDDQAEDAFRAALDVWPEHVASTQALVRLRVRRGEFDEETMTLLRDVAYRGESAEWRDWARLEATRRGTP
jgi:Tfp pilus assembly protein PilF